MPITPRNGLLWGLAGFLAVHLAPAAGLAPELPGMPAADLVARQIWWIGTIIATGVGIWLFTQRAPGLGEGCRGRRADRCPHVIGAPQPPTHESGVPAGLAAEFAANHRWLPRRSSGASSAVFLGFALDRFVKRREPHALEKIPATVITGFLGAGKTTLIRHLLQNAEGTAASRLVINEFGDVGVDGEILKGCGADVCREEDIVELANGCICCTVADDFIPAMQEAARPRPKPPEHIVIETSGLALPQPLVRAFNWPEIKSRVTVDGVGDGRRCQGACRRPLCR